jgi:branched-subunit amino acid aminotransferase/4-amino-4-deoxychorismate lyase
LGIEVRHEPFSLEFLRHADEALLCGTTTEVIGVTILDDEAIADGRVGPLTRQLAAAYRKAVLAGRDALRLDEGESR